MTDVTGVDRRELLAELLRERMAAANGVDEAAGFAGSVNPDLAKVLTGLGLDKRYVRGEGCWLHDDTGQRYLDFTAAYGALPFGHAPNDIWKAIGEVRDGAEPIFVQPSILGPAGALATQLVRAAPAGLDRVTFVNSGAEAVEIALKIARSATSRAGVLTTHNAFHGKTLGALSATGRDQYQVDFGAPVPGFHRLPFGDLAALEAELAAQPDFFAAFVIEPIQGEGGVYVAPPGFLAAAKDLCAQYGVLLVLDEVQTGLGRTGRLFACEHDGVVPDVLALAKALGGGVLPAGAVLCRGEHVTESFALRHTSTFAGNALSCRVGSRVLELLTHDNERLVRDVGEHGDHLLRSLSEVAARYPEIVTAVRGRGFLLGLELTDDASVFGAQGLLGSMATQETLALVLCSYLLNVERVRLAPTLFGARVLRIEPPLVATRTECDQFVAALDRALAHASAGDLEGLLGHLVGRKPPATVSTWQRREPVRPAEGDSRFAFIVHPLEPRSFYDFDPALQGFDEGECVELMARFERSSSLLSPGVLVVGGGRVASPSGAGAYGELIGLPYTARQLMDLPTNKAVSALRDAVTLARERGAEIVGLGAYSSIVSGNARYLDGVGVPLTTGNGLTAVAAVEGVRRAAKDSGLDLATATVAVVGASGSIGRTVTRMLARQTGRLVLVGNPKHPEVARQRLREVATDVVSALAAATNGTGEFADALRRLHGADAVTEMERLGLLQLVTDPEGLADSHVVVAATSTPEPIVTDQVLRKNALVCDLAQPPNVPAELLTRRPDVVLFDGGIVRLPGGRPFGIGYGLPEGLTYACMAETMLLALGKNFRLSSVGDRLRDDNIARLWQLAETHDFDLAPLTTWRGTAGVER